MEDKWIIKDWAGRTYLFEEDFWESFDEAESFLAQKLAEKYEKNRMEYVIQRRKLKREK